MNKAKVRNFVQGPMGAGAVVALALVVAVPLGTAAASEVAMEQTVSATRGYELTDAVTEASEAAEKEANQAARQAAKAEQEAAAQAAATPSRVTPTQNYNMTAYFGQSGGYWSSGYHTGQDFAAPTGTPVYAAHSGTVVEAGWGGAYGNVIVIQGDDGYQTRYAHNNSMSVSVGQQVSAGQQIATVGATGNVTGAHLHFEVMDSSGSFIDPMSWLNG